MDQVETSLIRKSAAEKREVLVQINQSSQLTRTMHGNGVHRPPTSNSFHGYLGETYT